MLDIFSGLRLVVKRRSICIDNAIFRCHWFFTSTLLISFSLIITARQYVGQPIECHSVSKIPDSLLNSYCWVQSTFTVPQACNQQPGLEVPYPCIDNTRGREIKLLAYYQWVGIVLFVQGLLFHLPYYLWKVWENGLIKAITGGLHIAVLNDQERIKKRNIVVDYIHDHLGCHKRYAYKYFLCEFISLLNLLGQIWATNKFFDGQFLRYGLDVIQYSSSTLSSQFGQQPQFTSSTNNLNRQSNNDRLMQAQQQSSHKNLLNFTIDPRINTTKVGLFENTVNYQTANNRLNQQIDPMMFIFPRITKCTYYDFGSSGDVQKHDALCLLPLNIINEKLYIALWFWFVILAILTLLVIIYRLFAIVCENVRCKGLISRCKLSNERDIQIICHYCDVGDWFLFYMVAENLDPLIMREVVSSVANKIRAHVELKRSLGINDNLGELQASPSSDNSYKLFQTNSLDELIDATSRRNSLAEEAPLVKKVKKRLYSKRLWSMDLGAPELRQQLFGTRQPPTNPDHLLGGCPVGSSSQINGVESAPPASEMLLNAAPPLQQLRRASITRMISSSSDTSSTSNSNDSFVMEMQTISRSANTQSTFEGQFIVNSKQREPLLRHRTQAQHHHSMSSVRELRPPVDCSGAIESTKGCHVELA